MGNEEAVEYWDSEAASGRVNRPHAQIVNIGQSSFPVLGAMISYRRRRFLQPPAPQ